MTRAVFFLSTIPCKFVGQIGYISNLLSDKFLVCNKKTTRDSLVVFLISHIAYL